MASRNPKITYTYNDITFSTASKVVAKMAKSGNLEGAYNRYISDTAGRQLRGTDMAKKTRQSWMRSFKAGYSSIEDIKEAKKAYKAQVAANISENISEQYRDVLDQLRDSSDPAVRALADDIQDIIDYYAERYRAENNAKMQKAMRDAIERAKDNITEEGLEDLEKMDTSLAGLEQQEALRESMRNSRLLGRG